MFLRTLVFSICLFASSFTFWRSEIALTKQRRGSMLGWLTLTIVLGGIFLVGQGTEYWKLFQTGVDLSTNLFSTTFFTLTGFHGLHVLLGLIALLIFLWLAWEGDFASGRGESAFQSVGSTGTLSTSSGSLSYSRFTSFHLSDDDALSRIRKAGTQE